VDLIEELIVTSYDAFISAGMLQHVPEAGEVLSPAHRGWFLRVSCTLVPVLTRRPVCVQVDVDIALRVAGDMADTPSSFASSAITRGATLAAAIESRFPAIAYVARTGIEYDPATLIRQLRDNPDQQP
jgi:hypothetical protein